jgi:glycosyltransferase involved in cell wall biosynthesis
MANNLGISHKITWTGMLKGDLKYGAYYCAEAFLLPSHQENFGIVVAEALACATPVLISNKVNIWREIIEDKAGLVEDDNLAGVTTLFEKWLCKNAKQRSKISQNALQCFDARFEIKEATNSLINVLSIKEAEIRPI